MLQIDMRCPVCQGHDFFAVAGVFDDRYGEPNSYHLARCTICDHVATAPRLRDSDLPTLYGTYYPRKKIVAEDVANDAAKARHLFSSLVRWWSGTSNQGQFGVRVGETMLDVGCGSGASLLEAKALGAIAFGVEADPNVKPIAAALGLNIHFGCVEDRPFPEQSFDLIVMNQVIEHLPDPDISLRTLSERMTSSGRMVIVFPNTASLWRLLFGDRWINWHIPYHLHHFDRRSFERMARHCGLEVVCARTITPNVWTLQQLRASRYLPKRGRPSPIWTVANRSDSATGNVSNNNLFRKVLRLGALSVLAFVNRVVDALGMGDSLLVELRRSKR